MKLTLLIILINFLVFFISLSNPVFFIENYGFSPSRFLSGNYEIIVTSIFLHANFLHLLFNMISLFFLGAALEKKINGLKYIFIYFLTGIFGNLAMCIPFLYNLNTIGIGASGSISGLVGLGTFLYPGQLVVFQTIIPLPFVVVGALYFLTTSMNLFIPSNIAYPVHFISLISGSLFGIFFSKSKKKKNILIFILVLLLITLLPYILRLIIWVI